MKKQLIKIFLLIISILFLCSCEEKEYKLIELTTEELSENLINSDENFVFAFYNEDKPDAQEFKKNLERMVEKGNINIYYLDYMHMSIEAGMSLFYLEELAMYDNSYYVKKDNQLIVGEVYCDYATMYRILKRHAYNSNIKTIEDSVKKEHLNEAKKLLEEGKISLSYEALGKAWTLKEAKEFYAENNIYNILDVWERYEFKDSEMKEVTYYSMSFLLNANYYETGQKEGEYDGFDKTITPENIKSKYYYIKDNYIYTSNDEKKYKKTYFVEYLDKDDLHLKELKTNKSYKYIKR